MSYYYFLFWFGLLNFLFGLYREDFQSKYHVDFFINFFDKINTRNNIDMSSCNGSGMGTTIDELLLPLQQNPHELVQQILMAQAILIFGSGSDH